jgi:hypothetical protein
MDPVEDVPETRTTSPFDVVSGVPCLESGYTATWGTSCMPTEARGSECTQDELVCWKTQAFRDSFGIAELYVLFYGPSVTFEG